MLGYTLAIICCVILIPVLFVSVLQVHLVISFLGRYRGKIKRLMDGFPAEFDASTAPFVTVQLPVYNERFVVERLLRTVAELDYPREKFEIQLLDDSNDETTEIAERVMSELRTQYPDLQMSHVRRENREGYKAGALTYGMEIAQGELFAVFDADFVPPANFLKNTVPYFRDDKVGAVQTRWGHVNENYSLLTRLQAFMLNGFFSVEQAGRCGSGFFMNFIGTAGVLRREAILEAGGWSHDTITEDIDISYRAQLNGWNFVYLFNQVSPAELPATFDSFKSQQHRWNKGGTEVARKLGWRILTSRHPLITKLHAGAHFTYFSNYLFVLLALLLSVPSIYLLRNDPYLDLFAYTYMGLNLAVMLCYSIYFMAAYFSLFGRRPTFGEIGKMIVLYPVFVVFYMGMSFHNAMAVLEAYLGVKTPFVRTPKLAIVKQAPNWKQAANYVSRRMGLYSYIEGLLVLYFLGAAVIAYQTAHWELLTLEIQYALGFAFVFGFSVMNAMRVNE